MKKTLTILTILAIALVAMMGSVNATTDFVGSGDAVVGGIVSVTIKVPDAAPIGSLDSKVTYDTNLLTYTGCKFDNASKLSADAIDRNGTIQISAFAMGDGGMATFTYATLNFTAKAPGVAKFTILDGSFDTNTHETLGNNEVTVNITAPTTEPTTDPTGDPTDAPATTTPSTPGSTNGKSDDTSKPAEKEGEFVGTDGKTHSTLPNTGAPVYIGAGVVIALAGAALVIRKIRK